MNLNPAHNQFEPFTYKTLNDLKKKINKLGIEIPMNPNVEILKQNLTCNNIIIPNRLAVQPMEGFDANLDGTPGKLTFRRYKRYARGGAGLIWFEATAINKNCCSNPHQLVLSEENSNKFNELVMSTRDICNNTLKDLGFENQCVLILQLNHSGRYSIIKNEKYPIRAYHNSVLDDAKNISKKAGIVVSDNELEDLEKEWVQKAILAKEVGFDGIDIKACHGYLISELFGSRLRTDSKYGGKSLENRSRFFLNIMKKLGRIFKKDKDFLLTTRMGVYDGLPYPNGFGVKANKNKTFPASIDLSEPMEIINMIYKLGIRLINISAGNPHYRPHITRPYNIAIKGSKLPNEHPLFGVNRIIELTSSVKKRIPEDMIIIGSGYSYLRQFGSYIAAGMIHEKKVDICGFGRMALANPTFPKQIFQEGFINKKQVCITCSKCSELMKLGKNIGCVTRDPKYQNS